MIQCKRVYDAQTQQDGYRVLVDRLWPRGVKKAELQPDEWCKSLAPSAELRKAFHGDVMDFENFSKAYRAELEKQHDEGKRLASIARGRTVTLLYAAKDTGQNHALVLAKWLAEL